MRRAKIYVTEIRKGDRIARTRDEVASTVYRVRNMGQGEWQVCTTIGGVDTERTVSGTKMFWIEIP